MNRIVKLPILAALTTLIFASCSTDQAVFAPTDSFTERVDMVLEGVEKEFVYLQNSDDAVQLLDFTTYGTPSRQMDIRINLGENRSLVFTLIDDAALNPWEQEGGFSMFATSELDDKQRYVTAMIDTGMEKPSHQSNLGNAFPLGTQLNVFNVLDFNPANNEIFCRVIDLPMINTTDGSILKISGTFRGTVVE